MIDRTTVSAIAVELGVCWHTVSPIAMGGNAALVAAAGPDRMAGVRIIGIDEHRWAPRRHGTDGFVTVIIDLTPVHDRRGPARLLDVVAGRSATALASWLCSNRRLRSDGAGHRDGQVRRLQNRSSPGDVIDPNSTVLHRSKV
jgi:transposase